MENEINYKEMYGKFLGCLQSTYDKRDYKFNAICKALNVEIPDEYITPDAGFTYNQEQSCQCCACAYSYIRVLQEMDNKQSELKDKFCPSFTYANRKEGQDYEGMYIRECCKKGREGSVLFNEMRFPADYPQAKEEFLSRKDELLYKANPFRISSFYRAETRREIQTAIMKTKAVILSIPVFDCFYNPDKNGFVNFVQGQKSEGNHAVVFDGWKMIDGKIYWHMKNSWGSKWGNLGDGHCWLPEEYPWNDDPFVLVDEVTDMKFIKYIEDYKDKEPIPVAKKKNIFLRIIDCIVDFFKGLFNKK